MICFANRRGLCRRERVTNTTLFVFSLSASVPVPSVRRDPSLSLSASVWGVTGGRLSLRFPYRLIVEFNVWTGWATAVAASGLDVANGAIASGLQATCPYLLALRKANYGSQVCAMHVDVSLPDGEKSQYGVIARSWRFSELGGNYGYYWLSFGHKT